MVTREEAESLPGYGSGKLDWLKSPARLEKEYGSTRKDLQEKAEQDASTAALNNQKAIELGMQNQLSSDNLKMIQEKQAIIEAELQAAKSKSVFSKTQTAYSASVHDGSYEAMNRFIQDPEVSPIWQSQMGIARVDKLNFLAEGNDNDYMLLKKSGMHSDVADFMVELSRAQIGLQDDETVQVRDKRYTLQELRKTLHDVQMAYPVVTRTDGSRVISPVGEFISSTGLLKNMYGSKDRQAVMDVINNGQAALTGLTDILYKEKVAKAQAETGKLKGEGVKATGEGAEAQSKADLNKINIDLIGKILEGDGTAEEKLAKFQDLTNPELAIKRQTAISQQKKAEVDLQTSEVGLTKAGLDIVKTGKEIESKELDIKAGEVKLVESEQQRTAKVGDINTAVTLIDSLMGEAKTLSKSAIVNWASGTLNPESSTYAFNKRLQTLKSKASLLNMEQIKGVLTDKDMEILQKAIGNLDIDQTKYSLQDQLSAYSKAFKEQARLAKQTKSKLGESSGTKPTFEEWKKSKGLK